MNGTILTRGARVLATAVAAVTVAACSLHGAAHAALAPSHPAASGDAVAALPQVHRDSALRYVIRYPRDWRSMAHTGPANMFVVQTPDGHAAAGVTAIPMRRLDGADMRRVVTRGIGGAAQGTGMVMVGTPAFSAATVDGVKVTIGLARLASGSRHGLVEVAGLYHRANLYVVIGVIDNLALPVSQQEVKQVVAVLDSFHLLDSGARTIQPGEVQKAQRR